MVFTDTHTHLYSKEFVADIKQVVDRSLASSVCRLVIPSTSSKDHANVANLVEEYSNVMFAAYGLHPTDIGADTDIDFEIACVEKALIDSKSKAYAVGEVGLDMYWSSEFIDKQFAALRAQFELSLKYNLPLIIHVRDAFDAIFNELEPYKGRLRGVFHGFSGSVEQYRRLVDYGDFYFGIGGVVTFKNSTLSEVVAQIDINRIVLETDSPYLAPVPFRGKRNESSRVALIAQRVADIKGITMQTLSDITENNCNKLFNF